MTSEYDYNENPPQEHDRPEQQRGYPSPDPNQGADRQWQNNGRRTPDGFHKLRPTASGSTTASAPGGGGGSGGGGGTAAGWESDSRKSGERNRTGQRNGRGPSGQVRACKKCNEPLTGQFVRALDGTFHLDCFKCRDCGQVVASKFFPVDDEEGNGQYPLCETDYFRRLGLLCHHCGGALRGSYITALDRKYHVDHFTCCLCSTVFGAQDSYYEHDGDVYCHYHYSTQYAQRCNGCQVAILKQFVEIFRNGQNQHWHPECYMIHKFWNVRLTQPSEAPPALPESDDPASRDLIRDTEERMEEKVFRIWSVLSTFEESSAACISDMLLHVSNGSYVDGVLTAKRFMAHVEILFQSTDRLDMTMKEFSEKGLSYGREAKLLCKKIVSFFSLLSKSQDPDVLQPGVTPELLSLVTSLAHYLKLLIRICLQGALRLEREVQTSDGLYKFLDGLAEFDPSKPDDTATSIMASGQRLSAKDSDHCAACGRSVEDECAKCNDSRWHLNCVNCSSCRKELGRSLDDAFYNAFDRRIYCTQCSSSRPEGTSEFKRVSKLQQYVFLLTVALARLVDILRSNGTLPGTSGEAGSNGDGLPEPLRSGPDGRSKSHGGDDREHRRESSYENTLNDVRRLRSTRLDRHLSSSVRQARTSRVMDADGRAPRPGSAGNAPSGGQGTTDAMFGQNDAITLDDIPRIVAVEQQREQQQARDRASRQFFRSGTGDSGTDQQRTQSTGRDQDSRLGDNIPVSINRKFFSELSALEYFNVRHFAVLTMHPMVEADFSLEELLSFIETRKPGPFWKSLGKAFKQDKNKVKKKGVFGVPLDLIIDRDGAESTDGVGPGALRVPAIIDDIVSSMRQMDLSVEGVFRKNGNIKKQQESVDKINADGCDAVSFMDQPVIQLAALLKRYMRDLPDPLMTHKLYRLWITAAKIPDVAQRKHCLHLTCCLLPKSHRDCLEILFSFLKWAGSFHQLDEELGSKMDIRNLATVIAPNILTNTNKAPALDSEAIFVIDAVEMLISNIEDFCQVPDEITSLLADPHLFNNNEISTKEILKRFQDRRGQLPPVDVNEVYNRQESSTRPPPRRVETDPAVLQSESTVRPIHDLPINIPHPNTQSQGTSPQQRWRGPSETGQAPFSNPGQFSHSDTHLESAENGRRDWRNSGWARQNGGLGISGNS